MKSQTSANLIHKNDLQSTGKGTETNHNTQIEGTPFRIVQYGTNWNLEMGTCRLNEKPLKSKEEVMEYLDVNSYNIIVGVIIIVVNDMVRKGTELINNQNAQQ